MDGSSDKITPSHPFTMADVEVMRVMRLRHTRRKFRMIIGLQVVLSVLIVLWIAYIATSYITSKPRRLHWTSDWIILVSVLLTMVNIASVAITVKKYRASLRFLKDPATHPDLILSGDMPCRVLKTATLAHKKTAPSPPPAHKRATFGSAA